MSKRDTLSETELVEAARLGDHAAFRRVVELHHENLARTVVSIVGNRGDAEDVLQEVFVQFHKSLAQFRGDASLKTYLNRIAVNKSLDRLRSVKRQRNRFVSRDEHELVEIIGTDDPAVVANEKALVWGALDSLPEEQRAVLVLRMIDGYSTEETSDILGVKYGTVLSRLSRGMAKLKESLGPLLNEPADKRRSKSKLSE